MLTQIDYQLFAFFNTVFSNSFFDVIIPHITKERNLIYLYFFVSTLHIVLSKNKALAGKRVLIATLLLIISDAIGHRIIKEIFARPRPSSAGYFINGVHQLFPQCNFVTGIRSSLSFPSNHAITNAALATVWSLWFPKAAKFLVPFALFIGFTRIYIGVHYPFDVFFGFVFGFGFAIGTYYLTKRWAVSEVKN